MFRSLFHDNIRIYKSIDENYEKVLLADFASIPNTYLVAIAKYVAIFQAITECIDFHSLLIKFPAAVKEIPSIDVFAIALSIVNTAPALDAREKAQVRNVLAKVRPIINCVSQLLKDPIESLKRYCGLTDNSLL
jgi:hypothetical protein